MGMYTEFNAAFKLIENVPEEIAEKVKLYCNKTSVHDDLDFGWKGMFWCHSYYFDADPASSCRFDDISKQYHVSIRCNLKNYHDEIENFVDWVWPYIEKQDFDLFLGYKRYEEDELPTLLINDNGDLKWMRVQFNGSLSKSED